MHKEKPRVTLKNGTLLVDGVELKRINFDVEMKFRMGKSLHEQIKKDCALSEDNMTVSQFIRTACKYYLRVRAMRRELIEKNGLIG